MTKISLTQLRRDMTRLLPLVKQPGFRLVIWRHRTPIAVIVSMDEYDRLISWEDEDLNGPLVDPGNSLKRRGGKWVDDTGWKPDRPPLKPRPPEAGGAVVEEKRKRWGFWCGIARVRTAHILRLCSACVSIGRHVFDDRRPLKSNYDGNQRREQYESCQQAR